MGQIFGGTPLLRTMAAAAAARYEQHGCRHMKRDGQRIVSSAADHRMRFDLSLCCTFCQELAEPGIHLSGLTAEFLRDVHGDTCIFCLFVHDSKDLRSHCREFFRLHRAQVK